MKRHVTMLVTAIVILGLTVGLMSGCRPGPGTEKPEDFYRGKTISLWTGSAGGTADAFARAFAPFLAKQTGANVVVANNPAGSSAETQNAAYKAKPDGLVVQAVTTSVLTLPDWFDEPGVLFDITKYNWLATLSREPTILVVPPQKPYQTIKDLQQAKGLKFGASTPVSFLGVTSTFIAHLLNLDAKVVTGMAGTGAVILSVQKGELDGGTLTEGSVDRYVKAGQVRPLLTLHGTSTLFPSLPVLTKELKLTKEQQLVAEAIGYSDISLVTTPGVPQDRVDFLRGAIEKVCADEAARQSVAKMTSTPGWYRYTPGKEVQKLMAGPQTGPEVKKLLETAFEKYMVR